VADALVTVRCMVDEVENAVEFYTIPVRVTMRSNCAPAFVEIVRGNLRIKCIRAP
jgi:hypothetical protein